MRPIKIFTLTAVIRHHFQEAILINSGLICNRAISDYTAYYVTDIITRVCYIEEGRKNTIILFKRNVDVRTVPEGNYNTISSICSIASFASGFLREITKDTLIENKIR